MRKYKKGAEIDVSKSRLLRIRELEQIIYRVELDKKNYIEQTQQLRAVNAELERRLNKSEYQKAQSDDLRKDLNEWLKTGKYDRYD